MKTETRNGVVRAEYDAIESVHFDNTPFLTRYSPLGYAERPTHYMVVFQGERRKRRVYATPIGNMAVFYIKTKGQQVYVELALDAALHRKGEDD